MSIAEHRTHASGAALAAPDGADRDARIGEHQYKGSGQAAGVEDVVARWMIQSVLDATARSLDPRAVRTL
jgi:hypothetical protein